MQPKKGFTLVELTIVVLILGALTSIAIPRIMGGANTAKINACNTNVKVINKQIELYYQNEIKWPSNYKKFTEDLNYFPDGPPECPFGDKYKLDEVTHRVKEHSH